ncbi:GHKL domain-containing protein [Raoultibacter phocaeensis]|uniref:GHKL domain-containing protein n=1 Tax=Raoultibacter phocaeensis TaxID=2479841 RepID=UPI0015D632FF|nr:GHKL domain-containing protein [Raoultibacter phocaeensis]
MADALATELFWESFFDVLRQDLFCWLSVYALIVLAVRHRLRPPAVRNVSLGAAAIVVGDAFSAAFMTLVPSLNFNLSMIVLLPVFFGVLHLVARVPLRMRAFAFLSGAAVAAFTVLAVDVALLIMEMQDIAEAAVLAVDAALSLTLPLSLAPLFGGRMAWAIDETTDDAIWGGLWIVPSAFCAVAVAVYSFRWEVAMESPAAIGFYAAACVLLVALLAVAYRALFATMQTTIENERLKAEAQIGALQAARYTALRDHMRETAVMRHDFRHRALVLATLADEGDLDGLKEELGDYRLLANEAPERGALCENPAVDAVSAHFTERAREEGVEVRCRLDLPERLPVPEGDFCMALANLLENAVEAAAEAGGANAVGVRGEVRPGAVVLTVTNSMSERARSTVANPARLDEGDLEQGIASTKHEGAGMGLASTASLARKRGGAFRVERDDDSFTASLALPFDALAGASDATR